MTAIDCTPESSSAESNDHPDDRREITAHLIDTLAFFKTDTVRLSIPEWHEDYKLAHEDLHRFDAEPEQSNEN